MQVIRSRHEYLYVWIDITQTRLCNILQYFTAVKKDNFQMKNCDIFLFSAQNMDCGYMLEPPHSGGYNEYPQSIFRAKIRRKCIPLYTPVLLYKSGVYGGKQNTDRLS